MQRLMECPLSPAVITILDAFLDNLIPLAMHSYGCRVVQRILKHCTDKKRRAEAMETIYKVGYCILCCSAARHYVVQP
jgi:pumilio RNA-binding family